MVDLFSHHLTIIHIATHAYTYICTTVHLKVAKLFEIINFLKIYNHFHDKQVDIFPYLRKTK